VYLWVAITAAGTLRVLRMLIEWHARIRYEQVRAISLTMTVSISAARRWPGSLGTTAIRLMSCGNCRVTGYERVAC